MKRYIVKAEGSARVCEDSFDTLEEAIDCCKELRRLRYDKTVIADLREGKAWLQE